MICIFVGIKKIFFMNKEDVCISYLNKLTFIFFYVVGSVEVD